MFVKFLRLFGTVFNDRRAIKRRIDIEVSMGDFAAGGRDVLVFGEWCKFFYHFPFQMGVKFHNPTLKMESKFWASQI